MAFDKDTEYLATVVRAASDAAKKTDLIDVRQRVTEIRGLLSRKPTEFEATHCFDIWMTGHTGRETAPGSNKELVVEPRSTAARDEIAKFMHEQGA